MLPSTFLKLPINTKLFILELIAAKIPLENITTTDFNSCPIHAHWLYITINYGQKNGGKYKRISNNYLNNRSLNSAIKFYNN